MKFFAFALLTVVAPLGRCQTFRRLPSDSHSVSWELKLEDVPHEYHHGVVPSDARHVVASDYGQTVGKTYTPSTFYKGQTYDKPAYGVVPIEVGTSGVVHEARYRPSYQPDYHSPVQTPTVYKRPVLSTVREPVYKTEYVVPSVHTKEYKGVHQVHGSNYGKVLTQGVHTHDYQHGVVPNHFHHY